MGFDFSRILEFRNVAGVILATVHGYAGAWLAVRMLFRPRYPIKLLGLTVFPQGMIPRHREKLADAIGKAVGEELVSQETVLEELFEKEFLRRKIRDLVDSYADDLMSRDYPSLVEALPTALRAPVLDAFSSLQMKIGEHVENVLKSEETVESVNGFVKRRVDEVLSKRVSETIDEQTFLDIAGFLEKRVHTIVKEPSLEKKITDFISRRVDDLADTTEPFGAMFTDDAVDLLKERANAQVEPIIHEIASLATAEGTRTQITALIKNEVHDYYENLPFFKKIFVSRENLLSEVDDLVNESMPKRVEELLHGEFFANEAKTFLNSAIDNALARPLPELIGKVAPEKLNTLKAQISKNVLSLVQSEEMSKSLSAYLTDTLHKLRPHSLDAILQTVHPEAEEKLRAMLSKGFLEVLSQPETSQIINTVLSKQIERLMAAPIGRLSKLISEEQIRSIETSITEIVVEAAKEKLPDAIREFNVGGVVRDKINNYPVEKLESLVLSVAKEHLRKIEFFGALFGLLIGLVQALLNIWQFGE